MDQTLKDIEILVVNDASTDASPDIVRRLAGEDPRIRLVDTPENLKLAGALNYGLDHARGTYIARMDDDDIALPTRLEVQKRHLDAHPDLTLLGSSIEWIDGEGRPQRRSVRRLDTAAVRWSLRFFLNISHPSMMFRRTLPDGTKLRYDPAWHLTEDHEMVARILRHGAEVACLPDVLLRYRAHAGSVSRRRLAAQMAEARRIGTAVQEADLPGEIVAALEPLRACYFDFAPATPDRVAGCFAGARAMLDHDIAAQPGRAAWLRRQTAQFLAWALSRGGASQKTILAGFVRHAPGLLPAFAMRVLEAKVLIPTALRSDARREPRA